jgi:hypothetical protein
MGVSKNDMLEGQIEALRDLIDNIEWSLIDQLYDLQHTLDDLDERLAVKELIEVSAKAETEVVETQQV